MRKRQFLLFLLGCLVASACNQKGSETVKQPVEEVTIPTVTSNGGLSTQKENGQQIIEETKAVQTAPTVQEPISDVDDAYEEGAAQAEEDRLAGHPGMNYADDYEDDDENEAYEEGYEDE